MAMKKAEMEGHHADYERLMASAAAAQRAGLYRKAVEFALEAWDHIDGMMQYERKYENREFTSIAAIEIVLRFAPLLFDFPSLDRLEALLKECRRIQNNTAVSLDSRLEDARSRLWENHRLWDYLERNPGCLQNELRQVLGGEQGPWRAVVEDWERLGLLHRDADGASCRLTLCTCMEDVVKAKCPSCGNVVEGHKGLFLEALPCSRCRACGVFVILAPTPSVHAEV